MTYILSMISVHNIIADNRKLDLYNQACKFLIFEMLLYNAHSFVQHMPHMQIVRITGTSHFALAHLISGLQFVIHAFKAAGIYLRVNTLLPPVCVPSSVQIML